ncbi:hypothetical protein ACFL14_00265 [Patescibacteria group bacterium]
MFTNVSRIIKNKKTTSFVKKPAQAASICYQAKIALESLAKQDLKQVNYKFNKGVLCIYCPHALTLDIGMMLPEIQKILDQRVGQNKIRTIKIKPT